MRALTSNGSQNTTARKMAIRHGQVRNSLATRSPSAIVLSATSTRQMWAAVCLPNGVSSPVVNATEGGYGYQTE